MFKQDGKQLNRQTGRRSDADRRLDCQADAQTGARNPYRQECRNVVDIQPGMKILGQAGRHSDRMANTWTGWQMIRQDIKQLDSMEDVQMQTDV